MSPSWGWSPAPHWPRGQVGADLPGEGSRGLWERFPCSCSRFKGQGSSRGGVLGLSEGRRRFP